MLKKLIIIAALLFPLVVIAQDKGNSNDESPTVTVGPKTKQQRDAEKKKAKRLEKDRKEGEKQIKQHYKLQDKETRKRMKKSRKEAERVNNNKQKGNFFTRLFKKKHH